MKPARFEYFPARSVEEACDLLGRYGGEASVLARGQSLGPLLNLRLATPRALVDINGVRELGFIRADDEAIEVGALTRQRSLECDPVVARACPLVAAAVPLTGHARIRNRGTVGGSLAHADPAAELPAVVTALEAELEIVGAGGTRTCSPHELFVMPLTTTLAHDELLVGLRLPAVGPRTGHAWLELARRHGDFALVGVACVLALDARGFATAARLVYAGVGPTPYDARAAAGLLEGVEPGPEVFAAAAEVASRECDPHSDLHASAEYRRRLVRVLTARALARAVERARGGVHSA